MGDKPLPQGAIVEIVENRDEVDGFVLPTHVFINGQDVGLIADKGIRIEAGNGRDEPATVTLTLLPRRIHIGGRP